MNLPDQGPFCGNNGRHCFRKDRACLDAGHCVGTGFTVTKAALWARGGRGAAGGPITPLTAKEIVEWANGVLDAQSDDLSVSKLEADLALAILEVARKQT